MNRPIRRRPPSLVPLLTVAAMALRAKVAGAEPPKAPPPVPGICPLVSALLTNPPTGFVALRAQPNADEYRHWPSKPTLPHASCDLWESREEDAHALRCSVNDRASPADVTAFYKSAIAAVEQCIAARPDGPQYARHTEKVQTQLLTGEESTWIFDSNAVRFKIALADYLRTATNSSYNSFSVEYLKY